MKTLLLFAALTLSAQTTSGIRIETLRPAQPCRPEPYPADLIPCPIFYRIVIPRPANPMVVAVRYSITSDVFAPGTGFARASGTIEIPHEPTAPGSHGENKALSAVFALDGFSERFLVETAELAPIAEASETIHLQ